MRLRHYQGQDRRRVLDGYDTARRVLYVLATGGGKTTVAVAVILDVIREGARVLILAHRRELIGQMVDRLIGCGLPAEDIGVILANDPRHNPAAPVQVASIQTLTARGKVPKADFVVVDEAHHAPADTYKALLKRYPKARVLGLTATPWHANGRGLGKAFDLLIEGPSILDLIDAGYLSKPRVFSVADEFLPDMKGAAKKGGDFSCSDVATRVDRPKLVGAIVPHWKKLADGRQTVCFAVNREHGQHIAAKFRAAKVTTEYLDGATRLADRKAILDRLKSGKTTVVVNVGVLTEGWDCPPVKCLIMARPTASETLYLQMGGRVLRPWICDAEGKEIPGKSTTPIILDHAGNALRFGLPQRVREHSLDAEPKKPTRTSKRCPECGEVLDVGASECACGHVFGREAVDNPLWETDGELVEIKPDLTEEQIRKWGDAFRAQRRRLPNTKDGPIGPGLPTWASVDWYLRFGGRGLPGGSSLLKALGLGKEGLTESVILEWARDHVEKTGRHPTVKSGQVMAAPRENWSAINQALRHGCRGLSGGSSLVYLLGKSSWSLDQYRTIVRDHHTMTGRWPSCSSLGRAGDTGLAWSGFDARLKTKGTSLSILVTELSGRHVGARKTEGARVGRVSVHDDGAGGKVTIRELSARTGLKEHTVAFRLRKGWTPTEILSRPDVGARRH